MLSVQDAEVPRKTGGGASAAVEAAGFLRFKIRPLFLFYNKTGWVAQNYVQLATLHFKK